MQISLILDKGCFIAYIIHVRGNLIGIGCRNATTLFMNRQAAPTAWSYTVGRISGRLENFVKNLNLLFLITLNLL